MECSKCGESKNLNDFYIRRNGVRAGTYYKRCKECFKKRGREYYHKNRERQLKLVKIRKKRYLKERLRLLALAKNVPCVDCKQYYPPWVMDFDHKNPSEKSGHISHMFLRGMWSLDRVEKEIKKCELVCSNCHRMRTYRKRKNNYLSVIKLAKKQGYKFFWEKV